MSITLGDFAGLLLGDFLEARRQADSLSASLSEDYHVNPLMNGIPIPHYTISEAEIDVPVQVVGVRRAQYDSTVTDRLLSAIDNLLPTYLYRSIKNAYYAKQSYLVEQAGGEPEPEIIGGGAASTGPQIVQLSTVPQLKACYKASTADICQKMSIYMRTYLQESDIHTLQLLDFSDAFTETLKNTCKAEFNTYPEEQSPYLHKQALKQQSQIVSRKMFFEFKKLFVQVDGLLIEPQTGKMKEYASPDTVMRVRLKLREQDLDFIVDENRETGESARFLSLS